VNAKETRIRHRIYSRNWNEEASLNFTLSILRLYPETEIKSALPRVHKSRTTATSRVKERLSDCDPRNARRGVTHGASLSAHPSCARSRRRAKSVSGLMRDLTADLRRGGHLACGDFTLKPWHNYAKRVLRGRNYFPATYKARAPCKGRSTASRLTSADLPQSGS